jgi:hypothetical protein
MILTTHILSGAVIGAEIKNPFYIAVISIAVHFLLDLLPHGDYLNKKSGFREFWKVAIDLVIGLSIVATVIFSSGVVRPSELQNVAIGIFFSLLPDGITFLYWKMGIKFLKPIFTFHQKLHLIHYPDFAPEREFRLKNNLWDILISLIAILTLFSLR